MWADPQSIEKLGFEIRLGNESRSNATTRRRFKVLYGTYPEVICDVWNQLILKRLIVKYDKCTLKRFFLMFDFLKNYCIENRCAMDFAIDEKTYRKWVWFFLEKVSHLVKYIVSKNKNKFIVTIFEKKKKLLLFYAC